MKITPSTKIQKRKNPVPDQAETTVKETNNEARKAPFEDILNTIFPETSVYVPAPSNVAPSAQESAKNNQASNFVLQFDLNSPFLSHIPGNTQFEQASRFFPNITSEYQ